MYKFREAIVHVHVPPVHMSACAVIASYSYGVAAGMHMRRWVVQGPSELELKAQRA